MPSMMALIGVSDRLGQVMNWCSAFTIAHAGRGTTPSTRTAY
jgi:hypothetical protein